MKFDVEYYFNTQNDHVLPRNGDEGSLVAARKQCPASMMVWAAVTESGRCPLFFVDQGVKLNQQNYRDNILVGALWSWAREHFKKTFLVFSVGLFIIIWGQRDSEVAFR